MSSHKQILKSTGIIGGAQVITIIIGIIRSKVIAVLLGPSGVGLAGMLASTTALVGSFTGLGIGFSAVRNVAEASGSGDEIRIAKTIKIMRRLVWGTGLLGTAMAVAFCRPLSRMTFNNTDHALEIAVLSVTLLLGALASGQSALLQGLRRIRHMALAAIIGSSLGLVTTLPLYWMLGTWGIVPALVVSSVISLCLSWWFARQIKTAPAHASIRETLSEGWSMVKLGIFMTAGGLMSTGTMYLVRVLIAQRLDLGAVGQFQAAWAISTTYLGMVLGAMGADYYPRLTAANKDQEAMKRLINEQIEVAILLAGPLIVGMISLMPLVVLALYSGKFAGAIGILRWQLAGDLFKVVSWTIGYLILAKGAGGMLLLTESFWQIAYLSLIWLLWGHFGLNSTGIAFLACNILHLSLTYLVGRKLINFRWSPQVLQLGIFYLLAVIAALINARLIPTPWDYVSGIVLTTIVCLYSFRKLHGMVGGNEAIGQVFSRIRAKFAT